MTEAQKCIIVIDGFILLFAYFPILPLILKHYISVHSAGYFSNR
ncbi:hypothetical protein GGR10_000277 [Bartonella chomelii]|uniref:Uncharacterized protein n=1 Tax=Bartonella chomelii TaxID=236402 RepID=A0ABR6E2C0_9HYPH|nr:hypothetical protein [Bartonella chomelii]